MSKGKENKSEKRAFWYRENSNATILTSAEAEIMRVVWDYAQPVTVRDVYETLRDRKRIAYTTVMSVMDKLAKKGILIQDKSASAYVYSAAVSATEVAGSILEAVIEKVLAGEAEPLIPLVLGAKKKLSKKQLAQLEELLKG